MDDFNLGVLTTTFTPAPNCLSFVSGLIYTQTVTTNSTTTTSEYKYHTLGQNNTSLCYPAYYHVGTQFYYSPAMCPSGWYPACGNFGSGTVPETRATCCPSGYSCMEPATDTWSTLSCISYAQSTIFVTVPDDAYQVWSRVVELQPVINAGAINVRWQSSDFTTTTAPSSTSTPSSSVPSTTSAPTKQPAASGMATPQPAQGLSTAGKIGIGVGIGGGALGFLLASALYLLLVRRKKRHQGDEKSNEITSNGKDNGDNGNKTPSTDNPSLMKPHWPVEMWSLHQAELQTAENTHEMGTASNIHEVNSSTPAVYQSSNLPWRSAETHPGRTTHELSTDR
ncbi:hypothetical protein NPX13_g11442 [Xylaria arbuscula]|uniref:Uncharacterized protein n=1 Tax=Xylaria arbuscula TaxID=114810 RepID=A0A9W8N2T1_9PEZI|nr:hypothetical protein NPX13_g11442 [Xylaria arbuscula]